MPALSQVLDEYRAYLLRGSYVAHNPNLPPGGADELLRELHTASVARQRGIVDAIVRAYQPLARKMARSYGRAPGSLTYDDLQQEASLGILDAIESFDPDAGMHFGSYVQRWMKTRVGRAFSKEVTGRVSGFARRLPATIRDIRPREDESEADMQDRLMARYGSPWDAGARPAPRRELQITAPSREPRIDPRIVGSAAHLRGRQADRFIAENFLTMSNTEMAAALNRSPEYIRGRLRDLDLHRERRVYFTPVWSDEVDRIIAENYQNATDGELAEQLGLERAAVTKRRQRLGLRKGS